jgi:hypothetical protein
MMFSLLLPVTASAIDILAIPMATDPDMNAWQYVPAGSEPTLYPTKRVYRGQPFRLLVLGKDYATDSQNNVDITYTIQGFSPNESPLFDRNSQLELFKGVVSSDKLLLLSRQFPLLDFAATDPIGTYRFLITAHDVLADTTSSSTAKITLALISDRTEFSSKEEFSSWIENYYRAPDPGRAITALLQYLQPDSTDSIKQAAMLTFLTTIIQNNTFLWSHLKKIYIESDLPDRKKILLISALSDLQDEQFFTSVEPELIEFYNDALKIDLLIPTDRPVLATEVDILWAEFMATGTLAPIRKLVGALALVSTKDSQEIIAASQAVMTPELEKNAKLEEVYHIALSSLVNNGERHSLVKQYLGYIYENDKLTPTIKSQIKDILEILQNRTNKKAAIKHLEQQKKE